MAKVLGVLVAALVAWGSAAQAEEQERWQALENNPSCSVWNAYPQPNVTVTWSGACVNGKAHGRGVLWAGGDRYEGDFRDGRAHGRGVYVWATGVKYEGEFRDGKGHGRGVYVTASGDKYEGDWKDGKQHGRGVLVWASGDQFHGEWVDGEFFGTGQCVVESSGEKFDCYWNGNTLRRVN